MAIDDFSLNYNAEFGFQIIGNGSIGGKARGLAFLRALLQSSRHLTVDFPDVEIRIPEPLVVAGSVFEAFVSENALETMYGEDLDDEVVAQRFLKSRMFQGMRDALRGYLETHSHPLAVRSSGMLEDKRRHAYAGLYRTYMLSNDQPSMDQRLDNLVNAVKLVYASTFYQGPKAYARRVGHPPEYGRMAVIIQQVAGRPFDGYYYPAISGVAQSRNYYPPAGMKPEDAVATIAVGLGKQVVSGERALRYCPKYPKRLIQGNSVEDMLKYAQRRFYALALNDENTLQKNGRDHVVRRQISDAAAEPPVKALSGTYVLAEHRIKETTRIQGPRVLTFAGVLKYDLFPLSKILLELLAKGESAMDVPVEIEFAVDLASEKGDPGRFHLLQMRPMTASKSNLTVTISSEDKNRAVCFTRHAVGNIAGQRITDIIYVKPENFEAARTRKIAKQVAEINAHLVRHGRQYLLVGPGRWGTADPWLGIPVRWADISNVAAIVETASEELNVEPSIGAHFFHNLASLGISYLSVTRQDPDYFDGSWLSGLKVHKETEFVAYARLDKPVTLKVDGRTSKAVIVVAED